MFTLGSDTSRQRYVSARFRDALKRRKIKNEIKLKVQTLKSTQPLIRHSHLFSKRGFIRTTSVVSPYQEPGVQNLSQIDRCTLTAKCYQLLV